MKLRIVNLESFIFRINLAVIIVVFILLAPTTNIIASWYPGKKDILWRFPAIVAGVSAVLWFLMQLGIPIFIKLGILHDRRQNPRDQKMSLLERLWCTVLPMITMVVQIFILIYMCMCVIAFMRSETMDEILKIGHKKVELEAYPE
ncbi:MAG: hypothetical protein PHN49_08860 [Candidatus Omnitrophica bacterium]|nr:hypothetical protein [Candidatus Omnitrophota bacterium]MDD5671735.1 hypothetical protein [Candidatus Omnitrophota bacterium]